MENKQELIEVEGENKISLRTQEGLIAVAQTYLKKNGDVILPPNYDVNDAVKALYLKTIQTVDKQKRPVLEVCTRESIEQVVQNYVSKGLNIAKNQCYLVCYGNTLTLQESYFGKQKEANAYAGITINSNVIYEGEKVNIVVRPNGTKIIEHTPDFSKFDTNKIVGAYAIAVNDKGEVVDSDIMTMKEIRQSWAKSSSGGTVHKEFPVEMTRKTVIARLAKRFINTSDDSDLLTGAINDTTSNEYDDERRDVTPENNEHQQTTKELLDGFNKSQEAKAKGVSNNGDSNENKEESSEEIADGQTELFNEGTIKPADEADS